MFPNDNQPGQGVNGAPQTNANGQYEVIPPLTITGHNTGHNPYEFIVNPNTSTKTVSLFGGGGTAQKIALIGSGLVIILIIAVIGIQALTPKTNDVSLLTNSAAAQQEIIRVATLGSTQATSQDALNFSTTIAYSITSSQADITAFLAKNGKTVDPKLLAANQSSQTDTALTNATASSTFDPTVERIIVSDLRDYQTKLRSSYAQASSKAVKTLLNKEYATTVLLLKADPTKSN